MSDLQRKSDIINDVYILTKQMHELIDDMENIEKIVEMISKRDELMAQAQNIQVDGGKGEEQYLISMKHVLMNTMGLNDKIMETMELWKKELSLSIKTVKSNQKAVQLINNVSTYGQFNIQV